MNISIRPQKIVIKPVRKLPFQNAAIYKEDGMLGFIILFCLLCSFFGIAGVVFSVMGGVLKLTIKLLFLPFLFILGLVFALPVLLGGAFLSFLAFLF